MGHVIAISVYWYILFASCFSNVAANTITGYRNEGYDLVDVQPWLLAEFSAEVLSKCFLWCLSFDNCFGIRYNSISGYCQVVSLDSSEIFHGTSLPVQIDNWIYYQTVKGI